MSCCCGVNQEQKERIVQIIRAHSNEKGALIPVLHEVQEYFGYLPYEVQKIISEEMNIPLAEIYGVATFYTRFSLQPIGKYRISACLGTACYVKGANNVLQKLKEELGIDVDETTPDGKFTLSGTRCVGACGLSPVVMVNNDVYGKVTVDDVKSIIEKYKND